MDTTSLRSAFDGYDTHYSNVSFEGKENSRNNHQRTDASPSFAGIPTTTVPGIAWSALEWEPTPVASVGIALPGGLWKDNTLIEKSIIKKIAAPLLGKVDSLFRSMTKAFGVTTPVLSVSPRESNIIVLSVHVQTDAQHVKFASKFDEIMEAVRIEAKLVMKLASLAGEEFSKAWFHLGERPDEALLPVLQACFELEAFLMKCGVYLNLAENRVDLPSSRGIKLTKISRLPIERTGILSGLQTKPQYVCVETKNGQIKLRLQGKGAVEDLGRNFQIGDPIRAVYQPKVELLKPFVETPCGGRLMALEAVRKS